MKEQEAKNRIYHYLLVREDGMWGVEFGDYSKQTVKEELDSMCHRYKAKDMRIVSVRDDQESIKTVLAAWNNEEVYARAAS